jgi:hypothetical protein
VSKIKATVKKEIVNLEQVNWILQVGIFNTNCGNWFDLAKAIAAISHIRNSNYQQLSATII